ncbi:hypothetical protein DEO72_LG8g1808 [Vigna unguiculata]|uniref:Uncharacterized protein n=1 Tax=Vigna unguiculata TaxID=3917 RepID=A0A4D6MT27_VIGUN|nr:hypothetical protein DEO72_LG8g1808 [Vigna unguiculata]
MDPKHPRVRNASSFSKASSNGQDQTFFSKLPSKAKMLSPSHPRVKIPHVYTTHIFLHNLLRCCRTRRKIFMTIVARFPSIVTVTHLERYVVTYCCIKAFTLASRVLAQMVESTLNV